MNQTLTSSKPIRNLRWTTDLRHQIQWIRGARHLVYNGKRTIQLSETDHTMLMAIEQTLLAQAKQKAKSEISHNEGLNEEEVHHG
jgi:phage terminase Nu1 subunit (DNA packaging protein)